MLSQAGARTERLLTLWLRDAVSLTSEVGAQRPPTHTLSFPILLENKSELPLAWPSNL